MRYYRPFHLVDFSPWPFLGGCCGLTIVVGGILYLHYGNLILLKFGVILTLLIMVVWWRDVIRESTYLGKHNSIVKRGIKYGMILFIVSEVMLFFSLFWAFFHNSLSFSIDVGGCWVPRGIEALDYKAVPLLNTALLLSSGMFVTLAHYGIIRGFRELSLKALGGGVIFGLIFTVLQGFEYSVASFTIADSVYGSVFYLMTGAHGLHVIIGSIFLIVCWFRFYLFQFRDDDPVGFELAAWYWHFVDVVWLFLYIFVYCWGC